MKKLRKEEKNNLSSTSYIFFPNVHTLDLSKRNEENKAKSHTQSRTERQTVLGIMQFEKRGKMFENWNRNCKVLKEKSIENYKKNESRLSKVVRIQRLKKSAMKINSKTIFNLIPEFLAKSFTGDDEHHQFEQTFKKYEFKRIHNYCYDSPFVIPRQGNCLVVCNMEIYLIGGVAKRRSEPLFKEKENIDVPFHWYNKGKWERQKVKQESSIEYLNVVFHTVDSVEKEIVIVGGLKNQINQNMSTINTDIIIYSPLTKKIKRHFQNLSVYSHASTVFGKNLLIHGGINHLGATSNHFHLINFKGSNSISRITFSSAFALSHHKMVTTLNLERNDQITLGVRGGIYCFGGINENGEMDNHIKLIRYSSLEFERTSTFKFQIISTSGKRPCPRKNHSMNLLVKKKAFVIIGGVNSKQSLLADIWFFDMYQNSWTQIQLSVSFYEATGGICKHSTISKDFQLIIYGGKCGKDQGMENFLNMNFQGAKKSSILKEIDQQKTDNSILSKQQSQEEYQFMSFSTPITDFSKFD